MRYTTSVGMATIIEPAAMRLSFVKNCPPRLASDDVIGRSRPWFSSSTAQKKSL